MNRPKEVDYNCTLPEIKHFDLVFKRYLDKIPLYAISQEL